MLKISLTTCWAQVNAQNLIKKKNHFKPTSL